MRIILCLFLVVNILSVRAQTTLGQLDGRLIDSVTTKRIPFATVVLRQSDGQIYEGTNTDEEGSFGFKSVPIGDYRLSISLVGYRSKILSISFTSDKSVLMLSEIRLAIEEKSITEVQVVGKKAIVEYRGDRLVYNVERDLSSAGGMAVDIMRKVPTLTVDPTGNIQIRGSGSIKVLVNGKPSSAMSNNLSNALKQMPASIIKTVEVITSPSAKYDAEGSAGIINITTKKAALGAHGNLNVKAGNVNNTVGGEFALKGKKVGMTLSTSGYSNRNRYENSSVRTALTEQNGNLQPLNILYQTTTRDNTSLGSFNEMNLDYELDSTNNFNLSGSLWGSKVPNNGVLTTRLTDPSDMTIQAFKRTIQTSNKISNVELNLGWTKVFRKVNNDSKSEDEPSREWSILSQYNRMPDNTEYSLAETGMLLDRPTYLERSTNLSHTDEFTLQTDYIHPFRYWTKNDTLTCTLEVGSKTIRRNLSSTYAVEASTSGLVSDYVSDITQSDGFDYNQSITSGYVLLQAESKRHWNLITGLRLEHTGIQGDFMATQTKFSNQYRNLIPNLTLSKTIGEQHTLRMSYTQRLSRPSIYYLNPYQNVMDPKNVRVGNPYLAPERTHSTELTYSTSTERGLSFTSSLFWRQTNNDIQIITVVDEQGIGRSTPQNIGRSAAYGLNVSVSLQPVKNLNFYANTAAILANITNSATRQQTLGWMYTSSLSTTYKFQKNLSIQIDGYYTSGQILLQSRLGGWYFYSISMKKELMTNKKASLTLNINNPLTPTLDIRNQDVAPGYVSTSSSILLVNRSIGLTMSYRFGKESDERERKKITNDDTKKGKLN